MFRSWLFAAATALTFHGSLALVPVVIRANQQRTADPITLRFFQQTAADTAQTVVQPKHRPPKKKRLRKRRIANKPTPQPQPVATTQTDPVLPTPPAAPSPVEQTDRAETATPAKLPVRKKAIDLRGYGRSVYRALLQHRRYPKAAARLGITGAATVRIELDPDGQLASDPTIKRSSGYKLLDSEALRIVSAAAPFADLPSGYDKPTAVFLVPIDFSKLRSSGS